MAARNINLGCGPVFVDSPDWINLDFTTASPAVRQANLLGQLPLGSDTTQLVYSSHFFEHIPRPEVDAFLRECLRVLQPGGVLRLVLPDLEEMARSYLALRDADEHERADFLVLEMIDQCVRRESGGELGRLYRRLREASGQQGEIIDFICERTGEDLAVQQTHSEMTGGGGTSPAILAGQNRSRRPVSPATGLGTALAGGIAVGLPRAKRQPRGRWRAPPLALGLPSVATSPRGDGLHGRGTSHGRQQRDRGFPLLSAGRRCRRPTAQGCRVDVCGGAQARLTAALIASSRGGSDD